MRILLFHFKSFSSSFIPSFSSLPSKRLFSSSSSLNNNSQKLREEFQRKTEKEIRKYKFFGVIGILFLLSSTLFTAYSTYTPKIQTEKKLVEENKLEENKSDKVNELKKE